VSLSRWLLGKGECDGGGGYGDQASQEVSGRRLQVTFLPRCVRLRLATKGETMKRGLVICALALAGLGTSVGVGWTSEPAQAPTTTSHDDPICAIQSTNPTCLTEAQRIGKLERRVAKLERQIRLLSRK
jgi:hypothetical protein